MDQNENIFINKAAVSHVEKVADVAGRIDENEGRLPCTAFGWGRFRPKCLHFLNGPKCFLAAIVVYSLCQGIMALGLITFVLPSIEKRFSFSSKELGIIASSNDISALVLVVFISFYGGYGNKIKWIGGGAVLVGLGGLLFSLPHFIVENYNPVDNVASSARGLCRVANTTINQSPPRCHVPSGSEWYYLMIFVVAQLIIGAGLSPFYSLLPAYLDENVEPKSMPLFLGIWYTFNFLGPGAGFAIGGKLLSIYVDIEQPAGLSLTPKDPRWIGAWWLGFLIFGSIILLWSAVILGFPQEIPGAKARRLKHIRQGHIRDADDAEEPRLKNIIPELKKILTNWTFLFNSLGVTIGALYGSAISSFSSKIFQLKFGLDPVSTGYVLTIVTMTSVVLGGLFGSLAVRMSSLKKTCKKAALMCLVCYLLIVITPLMFLIPGCLNSNLAGVAVPYHSGLSNAQSQTTPLPRSLPLKSPCNSNCRCTLKRFSPVCGSDFVTYIDACHAGCKVKLPNKTSTNCSCIPGDSTGSSPGTARPGYCDRSCKSFVLFAALIALVVIIRTSMGVPIKTVLLRCVPDNKRAFAIGIQYMMIKTLGLLPGPIIFGHLVDTSCRLWQDNCGNKGRCFDYDIENLSRTICFYGMGLTSVASVCYFLSWYLCKSQIETGVQVLENPGADSQTSPEETSRTSPEETRL